MGKIGRILTAFLAILDASKDIMLVVAEIDAVLDGHVRGINISGSCEGACCDIVPLSLIWTEVRRLIFFTKLVS